LRASASADARSGATPVANVMRTDAPGRQPDAFAQRPDGIEHGAGRARQRAAVEPIGLDSERPRPMNRARSVSHSTARPAADRPRRARGTRRSRGSSARAGRRVNSRPALCGVELGLDEQLPNAGCAKSSCGRAQTISA
jgi:hypothetical protein